MKIALAQIAPEKGAVDVNLARHMRFTQLARAHAADAVFFPELSLTGYEPTLARQLAVKAGHAIYRALQQISDASEMIIGAGLPTAAARGIHISMVILCPGRRYQIYDKQLLHEDESPYFVPGTHQVFLTIKDKRIAPAICYESLQLPHAKAAHDQGANIYVASVAKAQKNIGLATAHYPVIAARYNMSVLMINAIGPCDNFLCAGQTTAWTSDGQLAGQLGAGEEGLLIFDTETGATTPIDAPEILTH